MIPSNFKLLFSRNQISEQVRRVGAEIGAWGQQVWQQSHTDILAIPVLRGGLFVFSDIVREISCSVEIAPARCWAYEADRDGIQKPRVKVDIERVPARGRSVLLLDDICDSGRTLRELSCALRDLGANEVRSAVIVQRLVPDQVFTPDWVGFSHAGPEWFVGYGMDNSNRWSNLPDIYVIGQSSIGHVA